MSDNNFFSNQEQENQFVISYELICLLRWLAEQERPKLKRIMSKALKAGLGAELKDAEHQAEQFDLEEAQQGIVEFFWMLEDILAEAINDEAVKHALEKNLIPALEHIDSTVCNDAIVRFSAERASTKNNLSGKETTQELFFKEILRRWKPGKKASN